MLRNASGLPGSIVSEVALFCTVTVTNEVKGEDKNI